MLVNTQQSTTQVHTNPPLTATTIAKVIQQNQQRSTVQRERKRKEGRSECEEVL